jgi:hypothetical protein
MNHALSLAFSNPKTGRIPVSTHGAQTCPDACALKGNGCYAEHSFNLRNRWKAITSGKAGGNWASFIAEVKLLAKGQLWRYAQAGDLPGLGNEIDAAALRQLIKANKGKRGFTYTHKPLNAENLALIKEANANGFIVNLSADNVHHGVKLARETGLPVAALMPTNAPNVQVVDGARVVACPAEKSKKVTCATCALCAQPRDYVIGFRAHGNGRKKLKK